MTGVASTHADVGPRTVVFSAIIAVVFAIGGALPSEAQQAAPIVYAKSLSDAGAGTSIDLRAIDLRPGATNISFGPAIPSTSPSLGSVRPRVSAPAAAVRAPMAYAEPYAGPPYQVDGRWYVPTHEPNYNEVGIASWYGPTFHGKASASGETFDENAMTAAHPTLPIPSLVRVSNLENGRSVVVRLNDRGPFVDDRIIDLSRAAGKALDMHAKGTAKVRVEYIGPAPAEANATPPAKTVVQPMQIQASALESRPANEFNMSTHALPPLVPAPVAVQAPAPVRTAEQRGFFLQAGAYSDLGNAHAAMAKLKPVGPVSVVEAIVDDVVYYRVMVGPWTARHEAEQAQGRLIESGTKAFVVARLG